MPWKGMPRKEDRWAGIQRGACSRGPAGAGGGLPPFSACSCSAKSTMEMMRMAVSASTTTAASPSGPNLSSM